MSDALKKQAAEAALSYIKDDIVLGVGTGSTTNFFIDALAAYKNRIETAVASSEASAKRLKALGIPVVDMTSINSIDLYVDGADEVNPYKQLIKGGGGALTREKIIAYNSKQFVCIVDKSKCVDILGTFPLPIEVIPMARSAVAREIVKLGGSPEYREGFVTDNGNIILDVYNLTIMKPIELEGQLNQIPGVVCNGLFAQKTPDIVLVAGEQGVEKL